MADKSFTGDDLRQVAQQISAIWAEATPAEREKIAGLLGKIGQTLPTVLAGYSPSAGEAPEDGAITIPVQKLAASASLAIGIGLGLQSQTQLTGKLIQTLLRLGAEHIPGEITMDRKALMGLLADWGSLLSKISVIARRTAVARG